MQYFTEFLFSTICVMIFLLPKSKRGDLLMGLKGIFGIGKSKKSRSSKSKSHSGGIFGKTKRKNKSNKVDVDICEMFDESYDDDDDDYFCKPYRYDEEYFDDDCVRFDIDEYDGYYEPVRDNPYLDPYDEYLMDYYEAYDEEGETVCCDCGRTIKYSDGKYFCPTCDREYSRAEFFEMIGAEPPGPNCITCDNLYPGCDSCPYGYVEEDDYF